MSNYTPNITVSVEAERGCGFRKKGGTYLVGGGAGFDCGRFPIPLSPCDHCGRKWKQGRSLETEIDLDKLIGGNPCKAELEHCSACPFHVTTFGEGALDWVGEKFYTPEEFMKECSQRGASRRIPENHVNSLIDWARERAKAKGIDGIDLPWIALAHPQAIDKGSCPVCATELRVEDMVRFADGRRYLITSMDIGEERAVAGNLMFGDTLTSEVAHISLDNLPTVGHTIEYRHVGKVPDDDKPGAWVKCQACGGRGREYQQGIFLAFKPSAIEYVVDREKDTEEKWQDLEERGVKLVDVIEDKGADPAQVPLPPPDWRDDPKLKEALEGVTDELEREHIIGLFDPANQKALNETPPPPPSVPDANGDPLTIDAPIRPTPEKLEQWKGNAWPPGSTATVIDLDIEKGRIKICRKTPGRPDFGGFTMAANFVRVVPGK